MSRFIIVNDNIKHTTMTRSCKTVSKAITIYEMNTKAISYTVGFRQGLKRPFSTGLFFDWIFTRPSDRQSSRFYSFCALPRGDWCEGVLLHGS